MILARAVLNEKGVDNRCALANPLIRSEPPGFWEQLLTDHSLDGLPDLEKLLAGCEIIVALDDLDLLPSC
jgi:hypothetical protein